ncbi:DUF1489 family protein [Leptolyngbya sp. 15MV]|nr:DUF1489 family protein [Leptolyngbya sp. 15MV]
MPLHMTKIAFGAKSWADLAGWYEDRSEVRLTTRYLPKRHEEMAGGSLYWILDHALVARSTILGFSKAPDGRWHIDLEPRLIRVNHTRTMGRPPASRRSRSPPCSSRSRRGRRSRGRGSCSRGPSPCARSARRRR